MAERQASSRQQPPGVARTRHAAVPSASVRRNLFQGQLTRRPTLQNGTSSSSSGDSRLHLEDDAQGSDIVVRDQNGDVELDLPPTPPIDDMDEVVLDSRQQNEKERQRLADVVRHHQINQNSIPVQPEEILEAVRASLRAKVAALSEDNWMFEKEDLLPRRQ
ncbi:hypothetical protein MCOR10_008384 [Pyricularia oryzae]|nr:hypothetical protein MCOR10_008384 [Pyricularia oryzae]